MDWKRGCGKSERIGKGMRKKRADWKGSAEKASGLERGCGKSDWIGKGMRKKRADWKGGAEKAS